MLHHLIVPACVLLSLVVPLNCYIGQDCNQSRTCPGFGELCSYNAGVFRCECRRCFQPSGGVCVKSGGGCTSSPECGSGYCLNCKCICNADSTQVEGICVSNSSISEVTTKFYIILPFFVAGAIIFIVLAVCFFRGWRKGIGHRAHDSVNNTTNYHTFQNEPLSRGESDECDEDLPPSYHPTAYQSLTATEGFHPSVYPAPPMAQSYQPPAYPVRPVNESYQPPVYPPTAFPTAPATEDYQPPAYPARPVTDSDQQPVYPPTTYPTEPASEGCQPPAYPARPLTDNDQPPVYPPPAYPTAPATDEYQPPTYPTPVTEQDMY